MRLVLFTETFLPGTDGIVTRLCATLRSMDASGHDVLVVAPAGGPATYAGATIVGVPPFQFFLYPEKNFALPRWGIGKVLEEFAPDLVHVINPAFIGLQGIWYARRRHLPLVASYHTNVPAYATHYHLDFLEPVLWWYFRTLHNQADLNLATSRSTLAELQRRNFHNVTMWDRGVDVQQYASAKRTRSMRETLLGATDKGQKLLLYVGRLATEKQIERLRPCLEAMPEVHFAIVGDGPLRASLERVFAGTNTVFTGFLHGDELAQAYACADGFAFPSTTETLGLVLFESMAAGVPLMAAESAPTREVLENGQAGFMFNASSVDSLVATARALLYDEEQRHQVMSRARQIANSADWSGPTSELLRLYAQVVEQRVTVGARQLGPSR